MGRFGWGPDPIWSQLSISSITDAADGLKAVTVDVPTETSEGFTRGGQYVQLRPLEAEKASFIAIASAPAPGCPFEFLVKEQPPSDWSPGTGWLTGAAAGDPLEMSQVLGPGFLKTPEALDGVTDVLLFAAGSGIAPIRATIESGVLSSPGIQSVKLFYGCRTPAMMSYADKFEAWTKLGVDVTPVVSKPEGTSWDGATGYVQDAAKAAGVPNPGSTAFLLCGMKGMAEALKELAAETGVAEDRVLTNF